jgi:CheY-like chemotaxis protein
VTPQAAPIPEAAARSRFNVLLAEDNPVNQKVASLHLKKLGCTVVAASSGRAAVELHKNSRFDCIFMDLLMPDMDGFEATKKIRSQESGSRIPIIALTANAMPGDRERCIASGMDDYVAKPIHVAELQRVLSTWLASASQ